MFYQVLRNQDPSCLWLLFLPPGIPRDLVPNAFLLIMFFPEFCVVCSFPSVILTDQLSPSWRSLPNRSKPNPHLWLLLSPTIRAHHVALPQIMCACFYCLSLSTPTRMSASWEQRPCLHCLWFRPDACRTRRDARQALNKHWLNKWTEFFFFFF